MNSIKLDIGRENDNQLVTHMSTFLSSNKIARISRVTVFDANFVNNDLRIQLENDNLYLHVDEISELADFIKNKRGYRKC